jgi:glycosyltransferase involved in cell wall biosynthesis
MKSRILMFGWEFPPHHSGGLGVACYGLTRALKAIGDEVIFVMPKSLKVGAPWAKFVFADAPDIAESAKLAGVITYAVHSRLTPYSWNASYVKGEGGSKATLTTVSVAPETIYGWDLMGDVLNYAATGGEIARREQFDVIYAHDWLSFGAGLEAKRATHKPLVVHVHATEFDRCGGPWGVNPDVYGIEKAGMEGADAVIAVSEFTKSIIVKEYGIPPEKIHVVHNGIDAATLPQGNGMLPRLRQLKAAGNRIVLFLGRVTLQKGPDYFLRVAKRVREKNAKVMFVLSGSGDMEAQMMKMAAQLGLADKVLFTGFVSGADRHEMYASADLFVMPSVSEPFGITTLEAMSLGTPVLISKQSGVSEAVNHVLKADFWDVEDMANKILAVVGYAGLGKALSRNGAKEAESLTWERAAKKVDNVLRSVRK